MTTRLRLLCHAPTSAVRAAVFPDDEPVGALDLARLGALSHRLNRADRRLTSPALRARQTAEALGLDAQVDPLLRDCNYGRWTGLALEDVRRREPEALAEWLQDPEAAPHGGESVAELMARTAGWLEAEGRLPGRTVAVTHASVIRAAIAVALGAPARSFPRIDVAPLSEATLSGEAGRWNLCSLQPLTPPSNRSPPSRSRNAETS